MIQFVRFRCSCLSEQLALQWGAADKRKLLSLNDANLHLVGPLISSGLVGQGQVFACEGSSVVIRLVSCLWFGSAWIWEAVPVFERDFDPSESAISHKFQKTQR
jgi:hypothetical protein